VTLRRETSLADDFDLIVIGAGSGGVAASRRAAAHGARVLIAEPDRVGGTCVLRGCVPKKLMMYAAGFARELREAEGFGWTGVTGVFEMQRWADAKARELDRLEDIYRAMLADSGVELAPERARLAAPDTVVAGGRRLRASRVLIATGGTPAQDALPGLALAMTSNDVLNLRQVPASLLVIGGGYIGVEFASILCGLGAKVTLACRDTHPLRGFDMDLRSRLARALTERGVTIASGVALRSLESGASGYVLTRADGSALHAGAALNATGRLPNTSGLGLKELGVRLDARGAMVVDADSRSNIPGIWGIGDVTNRKHLTPLAIAEGRAFADAEFGGLQRRVDFRHVATAVFSDPPVATAGLSEADAMTLGPVDVYEADFRSMKTAFAGGTSRAYMKLVVDGLSDRVLGVHMIGPDAPEIVQSLAVSLTCGATKHDFDRTVAVHPTVAEEFVLMREPSRRHSQVAVEAL
jgi:glutathione reductase (NADPH)